MTNFIKTICVLAALAAPVLAWSLGPFTSRPAAAKTGFSSKDSPKTLYIKNCARCHGADGRGDTELGRLYDSPDISGGRSRSVSPGKLAQLIRTGRGSMPGFGKKLTRTQINAVAGYARGL